MKKYALIVAGGAGLRMKNAMPKQFLLLCGKPVLWHSLHAFQQVYSDIHCILVVPETYLANEWLQSMASENVSLVAGGETRFHSVKNGLEQVPDNAVVFVHDAVRCLLSQTLIHRCYEQTIAMGSAIPVVPATDSLRMEKHGLHSTIDRQYIRVVQTPQTFISTDLKASFRQPYNASFTDEATVMEAYNKPVFLTEGEPENIKITTPFDMIVAEAILKNRTVN